MVKNPPAKSGDSGDMGLIPGSGIPPGEGNGNPLQCSWLENPTQRSLAGYSPWGHKELDVTGIDAPLHLPYIFSLMKDRKLSESLTLQN